MSAHEKDSSGPWRFGNNGNGRRPWFVFRAERRKGRDVMNVLSDSRGRYRRYGSGRAAERVADQLNREVAP